MQVFKFRFCASSALTCVRPQQSVAAARPRRLRCAILLLQSIPLAVMLAVPCAMAQVTPSGPPAVGVVTVARRPMTQTTEINGRIQAPQSVNLVARVTAFLEERLFTEGAEVKEGDLLYRLERPLFQAAVDIQQAAVAQAEAQLENANVAHRRADDLAQKLAGTQVTLDNARAAQRTTAAQLESAQAQLQQAQINLDYTEIRSPIAGRIGRTLITIGNVVSPTSGTLATIVSQDPMYVTFPVPMRRALELRDQYASKGFDAVRIRIRLPNGKMYDQIGKLDFVDVNVTQDTDTLILRGTIPNPVLSPAQGGDGAVRELTSDEFVRVILEGVEPLQVIAVPRAAILSDQQGDYVYVVDAENIARQRRVRRRAASVPPR
jgi:membrane fusion protein (multidrug efflux system)